LLGVSSDEGFDEGGLAYSRRTDDTDDDRRSLLRKAIHQRDMQTLFLDLYLVRNGRIAYNLIFLRRENERPAFAIFQDAKRQKPWGYARQ
jgi:hypothetical protein